MKQTHDFLKLEPRNIALLSALAIGLGIAVHDLFFLVAALILLAEPIASSVRGIRQHLISFNLESSRGTRHSKPRDQRRSARVVVVLLVGFLTVSGTSVLYGGRSDSIPNAVLATSKPAKLESNSHEIERGPRGRSQIAITFDAGANAECFEDLIAALESARVHSTFFITGNWAQRNSHCAEAITKHGHEIGNHTWNHADLTKQPDDIVREELTRAEMLLAEISGQSLRPRFRAPFGARDNRVLRIAANLGYRSIYWTIDSLDSVEPRKTPEFLIDRITSKTDEQLDGAIILMHVGEKSTGDALPAIIANLQGRGFRLVTVSKLLEPAAKPR